MKALFTIAILFGTLSIASAQSRPNRNYQPRYQNDRENYASRDNSRRYDDAYKMSARERDQMVSRINREYNERIDNIRRKWFVNGNDKRRLVASLEAEKSAKISGVYARFADGRNRYNEGYTYNNRRN